jgi:hypothetical protein
MIDTSRFTQSITCRPAAVNDGQPQSAQPTASRFPASWGADRQDTGLAPSPRSPEHHKHQPAGAVTSDIAAEYSVLRRFLSRREDAHLHDASNGMAGKWVPIL